MTPCGKFKCVFPFECSGYDYGIECCKICMVYDCHNCDHFDMRIKSCKLEVVQNKEFKPCYTLVLNSFEWQVLRCLLDDYDDPDLNTLYPGEDWQDFVKSCNGKPVENLRHKMDSLLSDDKDGEVK